MIQCCLWTNNDRFLRGLQEPMCLLPQVELRRARDWLPTRYVILFLTPRTKMRAIRPTRTLNVTHAALRLAQEPAVTHSTRRRPGRCCHHLWNMICLHVHDLVTFPNYSHSILAFSKTWLDERGKILIFMITRALGTISLSASGSHFGKN